MPDKVKSKHVLLRSAVGPDIALLSFPGNMEEGHTSCSKKINCNEQVPLEGIASNRRTIVFRCTRGGDSRRGVILSMIDFTSGFLTLFPPYQLFVQAPTYTHDPDHLP